MKTQSICKKIEECHKVKKVRDKDFAGDWQYAQSIRAICDKCPDKPIEEGAMTKKRIMAMVVFSPIILTVLVLMLLAACVGYAVNGNWELGEMVKSWKR